jgi:hypothetical protein
MQASTFSELDHLTPTSAQIESICDKRKIEINGPDAAKGLGRLAVAIVNLLHELLERQAIRRMENGTLTDDEIDRVGDCLMKQSEAIESLCIAFGLTKKDLSIDLGPLGKLI